MNFSNERETIYDCAVVGAGIAGLAIAELAARNGKKVLLLESEETVCAKASSDHHGWFHMGSLYSIFWANTFSKTLIKGVEDLVKYYSEFPNMNITITESGDLSLDSHKTTGWFTGENISYYLACHNDVDFYASKNDGVIERLKILIMRIGWHMHLRRFIGRHKRFKNHRWNRSVNSASSSIPNAKFWDHTRKVIKPLIDNRVSLDPSTHIDVQGFDVTMRSRNIISDLLNSFISSGGVLQNFCPVTEIKQKQNYNQLITKNGIFKASKIVLACGAGIENINVNLSKRYEAKQLISPLMVTYPAIHDQNFVRMSPYIDKTINHLKHSLEGVTYSVIGGGYQLSTAASDIERKEVECILKSNAARIFNLDFNEIRYEIYWGDKTEITFAGADRNYQYSITKLSDEIWATIPGKFSLGFSLALQAYKDIFYEELSMPTKPQLNSDIDIFTEGQTHTKVAKKLKSKFADNFISN